MNLKRIDAAIAAYRKTLDAADVARLEFFRALWQVQDDCAKDVGDAYVVPSEKELKEYWKAERPVFADAPVDVDAKTLSEVAGKLVAEAVEKQAFAQEVVDAFSNVKWDRVIAATRIDLAGSEPSAWLADLSDVLVDDGMTEQAAHLGALFASMALKTQLESPAAAVMKASKRAGIEAHPLLCPVCGSAPTLAHVGGDTSSNGRGRVLSCPQCGAVWEFERVRCARCGTRSQTSLHFYNIEGDDSHRIATCDECGGYMRTLYSEEGNLAPVSYEVEDVVMARLDAIAQDPRIAAGAAEAEKAGESREE